MSSLILMLMLQLPTTQFLVSTKAGLVNYVQGPATVKPATSAKAGEIIRTGAGGAVEILLNPGSYLRMGENSAVVLEKVELYDIAVRIVEGSMIIEAYGFDKDLPLQVATGKLRMEIIKDGIYLFADGKVVVVDGKIRDASNGGLVYGKGYQVSEDQGYRAQKVKTFTTGLELWSEKRDAEISRANLNVARSLQRTKDLPVASFLDVWLWYPALRSFIYMPGRGYRSPYGYQFLAAGQVYSGGSGNFSNGSGGGDNRSNAGNGGGSNSSGADSGGGGGGGIADASSRVSASTGASSPTPSAGAQSATPPSSHQSTLGK